jgi:hypothetical protein
MGQRLNLFRLAELLYDLVHRFRMTLDWCLLAV